MLVIDRVELVAFNEAGDGNSAASKPPSARRIRVPSTKSFRSGTWARTLLATSRLALRPSGEMSERDPL